MNIIEIFIVDPMAKSRVSCFMVGTNGVNKIKTNCDSSPFAAISFEDGSKKIFYGMTFSIKTENEIPDITFQGD
jgi:hypothetical protein